MNLTHLKPGDKLAIPERNSSWGIGPRVTHGILTVARTTATQAVTTYDGRPNSPEVRVRLADGKVVGEDYVRAEVATAELLAKHREQLENLGRWRKAYSATGDLIGRSLHQLNLNIDQLERLAAAWAEVKAMGAGEAA